jgi:predicted 2-oxoglutarate/Fe(II)-dependent dioxygenase YbiX
MYDSSDLAKTLLDKIIDHVPKSHVFQGKKYNLSCLNERLRFLKYTSGQKFVEHCDSHYRRPDKSEISLFTVQFYLSDVTEGGATTFFSRCGGRTIVDPEIGKVLIFEQDYLPHEGSEVLQGLKYAIRTDVMYAPNTEL